VARRIQQFLNDGGFTGLTDHSFRVGGASLQHMRGIPVGEIKQLGRWKTDCYRLYIKPYTEQEMEDCNNLLDALAEH
jgi:hypothetical protein